MHKSEYHLDAFDIAVFSLDLYQRDASYQILCNKTDQKSKSQIYLKGSCFLAITVKYVLPVEINFSCVVLLEKFVNQLNSLLMS